eukprot:gene10214-2634_t
MSIIKKHCNGDYKEISTYSRLINYQFCISAIGTAREGEEIYHRLLQISDSINTLWMINDSLDHFGHQTLIDKGWVEMIEEIRKVLQEENELLDRYKQSEPTLTMRGEENMSPRRYAIVIEKDRNKSVPISIYSHAFETLQYPLLYFKGTPGFIFYTKEEKQENDAKHSYLLYIRSILLNFKKLNWSYFGRLSCEWSLDMFSRYE